jgi:hypothetical protein
LFNLIQSAFIKYRSKARVSNHFKGPSKSKSETMPFSSEEWEEISQTIPSTDEPFLQKYIDSRDALIAQEAKQRSGQ